MAVEGRTTSTFRVTMVALTTAVALVLVPSAQAANVVPNPGFETDCSGTPCNWGVTGPSVQMTRDTLIFHTGVASMIVTTGVNGTGAVSECFAAPAGLATISFWYSTMDQDVFALRAVGTSYTSTDCTGIGSGVGGDLIVSSPVRDGGWYQASGSFGLLPMTQSMKLFLIVDCGPTIPCGNEVSSTANFDDVVLDPALAATVVSFKAKRARHGVVVRWRTGAEVDTLGFNVFRQRPGGRRMRVNRRIVPALSLTQGGVGGGAYSFVDRRAPRRGTVRYWLQEVDVRGHRTWHGPIRARSS